MPLAMADEGGNTMDSNQPHFSMPDGPVFFQGAMNNGLGVAQLLALSVWLPLRKFIGRKIVSIPNLAGMFLLMNAVSWIGNVHIGLSIFSGIGVQYDNDSSLSYYSWVVLALGIWQHWQRLQERKLGLQPHRYSVGEGRFYGYVPMLERQWVDMLVDPAVAFVSGGLIRYELGFGLLGLWLMWSAVATCGMEIYRHRRGQEMLEIHTDVGIEARAFAEIERKRKMAAGQQSGGVPSVIIPTGTDDGLQALIEKNKLENPSGN
jgi:hypothetical protein